MGEEEGPGFICGRVMDGFIWISEVEMAKAASVMFLMYTDDRANKSHIKFNIMNRFSPSEVSLVVIHKLALLLFSGGFVLGVDILSLIANIAHEHVGVQVRINSGK